MNLFYHLCRTLCVLLWCLSSAQATNLIVQQAYWEDASAQADWAHAQKQNYTPYVGTLNQGYTHAATWLRIRLSSKTDNPLDRHIVLRVLPNYLDEIELFDPLDPRPTPRRVGDTTAIADQEYKSTAYGFLLPIRAGIDTGER